MPVSSNSALILTLVVFTIAGFVLIKTSSVNVFSKSPAGITMDVN
ncbi:hypothetical protein [Polaribacter sp.]|nr:hypothetical protein [Polaribacter sp.]